MTIVIAGSARIRSDAHDAARAAAARMRAATLAEPGCIEYRFATALDDPDVIVLHEQWADAQALDAHMATPHMAEFAGELAGLLAGEVEFARFEIASQRPLFDAAEPGADDVTRAAEEARSGQALGRIADRVLLDNELVRVWEMVLEPGQRSEEHRHELPYLMCIVAGDRIDAVQQDPPATYEIPVRPGSVLFVPPGATEHASNGGTGRFHELLIELKQPAHTPLAVQTANLPGASETA